MDRKNEGVCYLGYSSFLSPMKSPKCDERFIKRALKFMTCSNGFIRKVMTIKEFIKDFGAFFQPS